MTVKRMDLRWVQDHDAVSVVIPGAFNIILFPELFQNIANQLISIYYDLRAVKWDVDTKVNFVIIL